jgi:type II pantothenate kinase
MEQNTTKILLEQTQFKIPSDTIGIDIGASLQKIAIRKDNEIILKIGETNFKEIEEFLDLNKSKFNKINFTGGKAYKLYKKYSNSISTNLINEFEANIRGIEFLYEFYKKKVLPPSLIVTLGTGTSLVLKRDKIEHLGGSAMGGGFFMGLIKLLFDMGDYFDAIELVRKGNRFNIDLKVADIYDIEDIRVDKLFREFTAASLGKINRDFDIKSIKKEDLISSLIGIIGENIGTIATLMAENYNLKNIVFCGGFLLGNKPLKQILSLLCKFKGKKAIFLKNSEYCGAIGALLFNNK